MSYHYHKMVETHHREMHQSAENDRLAQSCRKHPSISVWSHFQQFVNRLYHTVAVSHPVPDVIRVTDELQRIEV